MSQPLLEVFGYSVDDFSEDAVRHREQKLCRFQGGGVSCTKVSVEHPLSGALSALESACGIELDVVDYHEHALRKGTLSQAAAYIECRMPDGKKVYGVGIDDDVATASIRAVLSAAANVN